MNRRNIKILSILLGSSVLAAFVSFFLPYIFREKFPPVAEINCDQTEGFPPFLISCDGGQSKDPEGKDLKFVWDIFDNSTPNQKIFGSEGAICSYTFSNSGNYNIRLTVSDPDNFTDTSNVYVHVLTPLPGKPKVILFSEKNFKGASIVVNEPGTQSLDAFGDKTQSIEIISGKWIFYENAEWNLSEMHGVGRSWELTKGKYPDLEKINVFSKCISSVQFISE